jgi:hypothetical protein
MSASVLAQLSLAYRHLWSRLRLPIGVELVVEVAPDAAGVDARHLVNALTELWPARAPQLLLSIRQRALLHDMLLHGRADGAWIAVPQALLQQQPGCAPLVRQAHQRGLPLVWAGGPGQSPPPELADCFARGMYLLDTAQASQAMQVMQRPADAPAPQLLPPGQILQSPLNLPLAQWALDRQQAWAVAGWPYDDSLRRLQAPAPPSRERITQLLRAIERDEPLDRMAALLEADPVLAYRFLVELNSPAARLREPVDDLHSGLMLMGLGPLQRWLQSQVAAAELAADLRPLRRHLYTRAQLLVHLYEPGDEEDLRRELHLCALFSQLDGLLREPLAQLLARLPLSHRIRDALLAHSGPYHEPLQLARLLQSGEPQAVRRHVEELGLHPEDVNRALLRTLANLPA